MMKKIVVSSGLVILSLLLLVGVAGANLLTNGSFENPTVPDGYSDWAVYNYLDGTNKHDWYRLSGQGIEIQRGAVVTAHDGYQYVELDSDKKHHIGTPTFGGSESTNSSMGQDVTLDPGRYELSFWYCPRPGNGDGNGIEYGLWNDDFSGTYSWTVDDSNITDWTQITGTFNITDPGNYTIAFAAIGDPNTLGGFIDDVELNPVPIPGAVWLLGSGLLGLIGIRRRKIA